MKFILLVEGDTEKAAVRDFFKRWLDPRLDNRVGIQVVRFQGYAKLVKQLVTKARMHLQGPGCDTVIAVIGLLDLYGPDFYPNHASTAEERYQWAVDHFESQVDRPKFRMFFAVHEFEAWLLSQPSVFPNELRSAIEPKSSHPETVNFDEPPSKVLKSVYRERLNRSYKKTTYGKDLFRRLDPEVAVQRCPRLKSMLETMLQLAKAAGL